MRQDCLGYWMVVLNKLKAWMSDADLGGFRSLTADIPSQLSNLLKRSIDRQQVPTHTPYFTDERTEVMTFNLRVLKLARMHEITCSKRPLNPHSLTIFSLQHSVIHACSKCTHPIGQHSGAEAQLTYKCNKCCFVYTLGKTETNSGTYLAVTGRLTGHAIALLFFLSVQLCQSVSHSVFQKCLHITSLSTSRTLSNPPVSDPQMLTLLAPSTLPCVKLHHFCQQPYLTLS